MRRGRKKTKSNSVFDILFSVHFKLGPEKSHFHSVQVLLLKAGKEQNRVVQRYRRNWFNGPEYIGRFTKIGHFLKSCEKS